MQNMSKSAFNLKQCAILKETAPKLKQNYLI